MKKFLLLLACLPLLVGCKKEEGEVWVGLIPQLFLDCEIKQHALFTSGIDLSKEGDTLRLADEGVTFTLVAVDNCDTPPLGKVLLRWSDRQYQADGAIIAHVREIMAPQLALQDRWERHLDEIESLSARLCDSLFAQDTKLRELEALLAEARASREFYYSDHASHVEAARIDGICVEFRDSVAAREETLRGLVPALLKGRGLEQRGAALMEELRRSEERPAAPHFVVSR